MKKALFFIFILLLNSASYIFAQKAPPAYVLPSGDKVIIVLGDTSRSVSAFNVYRADKSSGNFKILNKDPITMVNDPYKAAQLMGSDFEWISKKMGSEDPGFVYNRLAADRNTTLALCLISHGLRMAMGRTYVDRKVVKGKTYRYRVVLLNVLGKEISRVERNVKVGILPLPKKPSSLTADPGDGKVLLKWKYPRYSGGEKDLTVGFIMYRKEETGKFLRITRAPILRIEGLFSYIDEAVKNGVSYTYAVEAVNMIGNKSEKNYSKTVKPVDKKPPLVPVGLKALDKKEGVLLLWKISPETDAAYYNVYRGKSLKGTFEKINNSTIPIANPKFIDTSAVRGVVHYYRVTAVDKSGNESPKSGPASIIPKDTEPPPPIKGLTADVDADKRYITVSWDALDVPDLSGYYIYRGESKDRLLRIVKDPVIPVSFTDTGYKKKGLRPGRKFWYVVTGVDTSGNESKRIFIEVIMPDKVPPPPPFYLSAKPADTGSVLLIWQPCLSRDLDKHYIYREDDRTFVKIKELDKKTSQWEDKTVEKGKLYRYRVTEVDTSGNESKPSREVKVIPTDITAPAAPEELKAVIGKWGIKLSWNASPENDVKGYNVYSLPPGNENWRLTAKMIKSEEYFNRWAKAGTSYAVSAIDTSGNESKKTKVSTKKAEDKNEVKK